MLFDKQIKKNLIGSAFSFSSTGLLIPSFLLNGPNIFNITGAFVAVSAGIYTLVNVVNMKILDDEITRIKETDEYKEYSGLYREYVSDIATLFNDLGFKPDLSSCVGYIFCLGNGIFSENQEYKYTIYDTDLDFFCDTMGARVATGAGCCRHNVGLLTDIINEMGGKAACLPVVASHSSKVRRRDKSSHIVVGVSQNGKKAVFDPTVDMDVVAGESISLFTDDSKDCVCKSLDGKWYHHLREHFGYDSYDANNLLKDELFLLDSFNDCDAVIKIYDESYIKTNDCYKDFVDFNKEEQPKIKKLSMLNKKLIFHENKK